MQVPSGKLATAAIAAAADDVGVVAIASVAVVRAAFVFTFLCVVAINARVVDAGGAGRLRTNVFNVAVPFSEGAPARQTFFGFDVQASAVDAARNNGAHAFDVRIVAAIAHDGATQCFTIFFRLVAAFPVHATGVLHRTFERVGGTFVTTGSGLLVGAITDLDFIENVNEGRIFIDAWVRPGIDHRV